MPGLLDMLAGSASQAIQNDLQQRREQKKLLLSLSLAKEDREREERLHADKQQFQLQLSQMNRKFDSEQRDLDRAERKSDRLQRDRAKDLDISVERDKLALMKQRNSIEASKTRSSARDKKTEATGLLLQSAIQAYEKAIISQDTEGAQLQANRIDAAQKVLRSIMQEQGFDVPEFGTPEDPVDRLVREAQEKEAAKKAEQENAGPGLIERITGPDNPLTFLQRRAVERTSQFFK